ncbi:ArnT family glycosyltransferase [Microlunatus soli]|uniref:4-amino-4-deoxy-L-arabinose transferase n=1 Tax=Microlunatus soli TaxID=630515 RepID=A0A1H1VI54_9ACTN|nr:glycosyltransferase family 39 protein [Microlunatus soli]SDS84051.1 4-amino-4-deoxy-L-arabinose transferase [Microlunatus soli]
MTTTSLAQGPAVAPPDDDLGGAEHGQDSPPAQPSGPDPAAAVPWLRRLSVIALLLITAVLYLWSLNESGYANSFYSAAVQAGSESWKAFFFGSLDAGNSITVDKPPASLWLMALSVRLFGLSSWSILVPQALLGVATVGVMYAVVKRICDNKGISGHTAGLAAGLVTALTPSAALMFRFNNPDALLLFLLVLAGYFVLRATERAGAAWLIAAGALVGLGFLTKMMQAFLVLPAFALVYLIAAPTSVRKRLLHLLGALASVIVSLGWWVAIVELWPKSSRPYIDGSTGNSVLELVFGYNGLGRLTGSESGQVGGGAGGGPRMSDLPAGAEVFRAGGPGGGGGFGGETSILRLFQGVSGGMISWLIPAALLILVVALIMIGRAPRTDKARTALLLFGGSMITTGLVFSFMAGIYHDYYTVALAPWIAGTVIIGGTVLWRRRQRLLARITLAVAAAGSTAWAFVLLGQSGEQPYQTLRWVVLGAGLVAAAGFVLIERLPKALATIVLGLAGIAVLTGPAAYTVDTVLTPHTGSIVTAGPVSSMGGGPGGGTRFQMPGGGTRVQVPGGGTPPGMPGQAGGQTSRQGGGRPEGGAAGGIGGLLNGAQVSDALKALLSEHADDFTWVAATARAQNAASYQLATEDPVMAIGGFNGTAASPTLEQFKTYVASGRIHYFIGSDGEGRMSGTSATDSASQIQSWVEKNFTAKTVDGVTVYDLTESN